MHSLMGGLVPSWHARASSAARTCTPAAVAPARDAGRSAAAEALAGCVRSVQGFTLAPMAGNLVLSERLDDGVHLITLNKPCVHVLYRCRLPALRVSR